MTGEATLSTSTSVSTSQTAAIAVTGLSKTYRTGFYMNQLIKPLHDCSFTVDVGETFGLLGPNGAGKTTTIKCLLGIVSPTSGEGSLLGQPLGEPSIKQKVGYLPENPYFYDYLTAWEFLGFAGQLFQIPAVTLKERIPYLLDLVGLSKDVARKKQLRTYSKGMLQRAGMAQALINDPELVFLDEPMSGLDPIGRFQIREIIRQLKQQGKTVFFNSHILSDVEAICDRVALLVKGKLVCQGRINDLLGIEQTYWVQAFGGNLDEIRPHFDEWHIISQGNDNDSLHWQGHWLDAPDRCIALLEKHGACMTNLGLRRQTLEEFFLDRVHEADPDAATVLRRDAQSVANMK